MGEKGTNRARILGGSSCGLVSGSVKGVAGKNRIGLQMAHVRVGAEREISISSAVSYRSWMV